MMGLTVNIDLHLLSARRNSNSNYQFVTARLCGVPSATVSLAELFIAVSKLFHLSVPLFNTLNRHVFRSPAILSPERNGRRKMCSMWKSSRVSPVLHKT